MENEFNEKAAELGLLLYFKGETDPYEGNYDFTFDLDFILVNNIDKVRLRNVTKHSRESKFKHLADIKLQSRHYINKWSTPEEPSRNFQTIYYDGYHSCLAELEVAVKSLKKIHKEMDKMTEKYGRPNNWGDFISRYALASKVYYIVECMLPKAGSGSYDDNVYSVHKISEGITLMRNILESDVIWQEKTQEILKQVRPSV
jgi:hypothetical protein